MSIYSKEWLDDHGYQKGPCKFCGRPMWTDTGVWECDSCNPTGREIGKMSEDDLESLEPKDRTGD